jgi:hypothetical protein
MENARAALSLARIAGRAGFAGLTLSVFSPLLAGFFLGWNRLFGNLKQSLHAALELIKSLLAFDIFRLFHCSYTLHIKPLGLKLRSQTQ